MKKALTLVLAAALLLGSLMGCSASGSRGFDTPEAAVEAFMEAFRTQDVEKMLGCCYTDPYLERVDFEEYTDYIRMAHRSMIMGPVQYDYYRDLVRIRLDGNFATTIQMMTYSLLSEDLDELVNSDTIRADADWAEDMARDVDPEALEELEVLHILESFAASSKDQRKTYVKNAKTTCWADDATELVVVFELDREYYWKGFGLVEYDGKWYIRNLSALFTGEPVSGAVNRLEDEDALESLLEEYD